MKTSTFVLFVIVIALGLLVAIWFGAKSSSVTTNLDDPNRPVATLEATDYDFGPMSVREKKSYQFKVINTGKSKLVLSRFATSCDCTYASVVREDGSESKTFFMHADNAYSERLDPGQSVKVKVTYEPSIMPVKGYVERFVSFGTNDPALPKIQLKISATVNE